MSERRWLGWLESLPVDGNYRQLGAVWSGGADFGAFWWWLEWSEGGGGEVAGGGVRWAEGSTYEGALPKVPGKRRYVKDHIFYLLSMT